MNHDILIMILVLVTIAPLLALMWWIDSKPRLSVDEILDLKMKRIALMTPHCVHLWQNLITAIQNNKSESEINNLTEDVKEYLLLMNHL